MNDAAWRRPDMQNIEADVRADGVGCVVGGLLGAPGMSASPSMVSVEKTTGASSRVHRRLASAAIVSAEICRPHCEHAPANGRGVFFNVALMLVAGIQIVASRPITLRALSAFRSWRQLACRFFRISTGRFPLGRSSSPARSFPWRWSFRCRSIPSFCSVHGATANRVLGRKPVTSRSFDDFFEKQAREWKVPAEDDARAIEDVAANANGPVEIFGDAALQGQSACAAGRPSEEGNGRRAKLC
jgi:hypothetical protein